MKKRYSINAEFIGIYIAAAVLAVCGVLSVYQGDAGGGYTELVISLALGIYGIIFSKKNKKSFSALITTMPATHFTKTSLQQTAVYTLPM